MSLATQALTAIELARERHPDDDQVQAAADSVELTLEPLTWRDTIQGGSFYSACVQFTRADASWYDRTVLYTYAGCDAWIARLRAVLPALSAALRAVGDEAAAEVADAVTDSAANQQEITDNVIGSPSSWWEPIPSPLKAALGLLAAWIALDAWSKIK